MAPKCTICTHEDRDAIDEAIVRSASYRSIVDRFGVTHGAIARHKQAHLSEALAAVVVEDRERAGSLLDQLQDLITEARQFLDVAKSKGNVSGGLAALRELRSTLELVAKITGELRDGPTVQVLNLQTSAEWLAVRSVIVAALEPYTEAKVAVAGALLELEAGT
jgi:hypothetical protein